MTSRFDTPHFQAEVWYQPSTGTWDVLPYREDGEGFLQLVITRRREGIASRAEAEALAQRVVDDLTAAAREQSQQSFTVYPSEPPATPPARRPPTFLERLRARLSRPR